MKAARTRDQILRRAWVLVAAVLVTGACGTRMDRQAIQAAERGGLAASSGDSALAAGPAAGDAAATAGHLGAGTATDTGTATVSGGSTAVGSGTAKGATTAAGPAAAPGGARGPSTAAGTAASGSATAGQPGSAAAGAAAAQPGANPSAAAAAPTGSGTKSAVVVGSVATLSGPLGAFTKDYITAIQVWAKYLNGKGGLGGHPIRHLVADDGGDPARYNAAVRTMAEEQGAIAFIHNTLGFAGGDLSYVTQKGIPVIGHEGGTDFVYDSPMVFTPAASGSTYAYAGMAAIASMAIPDGNTKLAVLACSDVKLCDNFYKVLTGPEAREIGFEVVYQARPSLTQPDYTGECISARQAGANVMITILDNNSMLRVARSCARQNYKPQYGYFDNVTLPSVADDPVTEGAVVATKAPPWPGKDQPGLVDLHQGFATAAPGVEVSGGHMNGWVSAKTFEAAARNLPDNPTSQDILKGLWALNGDNLGGLTYPLYFQQDQGSPKKACWGVVKIENKTFTMPKGTGLTCKQ
jgi:ABC-type branched-subunit amino acid transport system substrate-binding protein